MPAPTRTSTQGPELMDVVTLMKAMETLHHVSVAITITPAGLTADGTCTITAMAETKGGILAGGRPVSRALALRWPNNGSRTPEGLMYRALNELDGILSRENWAQLKF